MKPLPKVKIKRNKKRVGRGYGSGKGGHTVGRGTKGQKARSKPGILFEGVKTKKSQFKRIPLVRGKGKFKSRPKPLVIRLGDLNSLASGTVVTLETLAKVGLVNLKKAQVSGVKILAGGQLKKRLTINLPISGSAAREVEKLKGKVLKETNV